ncbi:hypothetical protein E4U59_003349 [Claviceps monticola]|nr:hypothetical protein E4U59_003349 [Claviceps monticola]
MTDEGVAGDTAITAESAKKVFFLCTDSRIVSLVCMVTWWREFILLTLLFEA